MKKFLLITLISTFLFACQNSGQDNKLENKIFGGERELRKMTNGTDLSAKSSFFLFFGSSSLNNQAISTFAWQMNNGAYQISSIPMDKISVRFDPKATGAKIKFNFVASPSNNYSEGEIYEDIQGYLKYHLSNVEIVVNESDWEVDINMPLEREIK